MQTLVFNLKQIKDFRISRHKLYPIEEILLISVLGCICGCNTFEEITDFGKMRLAWLRKYLPFEHGIASHDTINRVLGLLDPKQFNQVFMDWVKVQFGINEEIDIISIDGKALCGTAPKLKNAKKLIHNISAWANDSQLVLGQTIVEGKGHEIAGIKALLEILDIQDDIITIDAIGCQTAIAAQIVTQEGHYVLAVKNNQQELCEEIENAFAKITVQDTDKQVDATSGRVNTRTCKVIHHLETYVPEAARWQNSKTIIMITAERFDKTTQKTSTENRYYISDVDVNAKYFNKIIRAHWGVENNLHWHLDVTFAEDKDRKRKHNLATNFALVRKYALNLTTQHTDKISMRRKQKKALMSESYLESILF